MEDATTKILEIKINSGDAIKKISEYNDEIEKCKKIEAELNQAQKDGQISKQEYKESIIVNKQAVKEYKESIRDLEKEMNNERKQEEKNQGSLRSLRAELSNATKAYDILSREERNSAKGKEMLKHLNDLTTELKEAEAESQRFQRNVGNYPEVTKSFKGQLRDLTEALAQMKLEGKDNTQEFQDMMVKAGNLSDAMGDARQQIGAYASDTGKLDTAKEGLTSLVATYQMWQMASQSLGLENKELEDVMKGLMGTLALVNAATTIANALESQSALMKGVQAVKTWVLNTALGGQAVATTAVAAAEAGATTATWAWNTALFANPIVWLVGLVVAAVAAVYGLIKAFEWATSASAEQKEMLEKQGIALDELRKKNDEYIEMRKAQGATEEELSQLTMKLRAQEKNATIDYYNKTKELYGSDSKEFEDAREKMIKANDDFKASQRSAIELLEAVNAKAKDRALQDSMGEAEFQTKKANEAYKQQMKNLNTLMKQAGITAGKYNELASGIKLAYDQSLKDIKDEETKKDEKKDKKSSSSGKSKADIAKEQADKEREAIRKAEDEMLKLVTDEAEKRKKQIEISYSREIEDLQRKLTTEKNLTEKAKDAIIETITTKEKVKEYELKKLSDGEIQKQVATETKRYQLLLESIKKGSDAEYQMKLDESIRQMNIEIEQAEKEYQNEETKGAMVAAIRAKYTAQQDAMIDEHNKSTLDKQAKAIQEEWALKTAQAVQADMDNGGGMAELEMQLQQKQYELDTIHQLEDESETAFATRKLQIQQDYNDAKQELINKEVAIEQAKYTAVAGLVNGISSVMEAASEEGTIMAKMAKVLALGEIAINTGKAIAAGVASAQAVPFPGNIPAIVTTVTAVLANVATAIKTVKSAKFAEGGLVQGQGTGTSDSIHAMLSNGESVVNARSTAMFSPILSAMNMAGGGMPINAVKSSNVAMGEDMLARAFAKGVSALPQPIVSVQEIADVNKRVQVIESISNI